MGWLAAMTSPLGSNDVYADCGLVEREGKTKAAEEVIWENDEK